MRAANEINLKMAPLTPDHHFYIDQGANAHVRLVLIAIGEKLVEMGVLDAPDDVILFRYNAAPRVHRRPDRHGRAGDRRGGQGEASRRPRSTSPRTGSAPAPRRSWPSRTSTCGASPTSSTAPRSKEQGKVKGIAGSPGVVEGIARVVGSEAEFDSLQPGEILVCQMTNPAWQVLYGKIIAVVTDAGGTVSHPAVLAREYGIPAVVGHLGRPRTSIKTGDRIRVDGNTGVVEILGTHGRRPSASEPDRSRHARQTRDLAQRPERPGQGPPPRRRSSTVATRRAPGSSRPGWPASSARARRPCARRCATSRPSGSSRPRPSAELASAARRRTSCSRPSPSAPSSSRWRRAWRSPRITDDELDELALYVDEMQRAAGAGDSHAEATADAASTAASSRSPGNATLERVWRTLEPFSRTYITMVAPGIDRRRIADLHQPVLDALRSGDRSVAVDALRRHFADAGTMLAQPGPSAPAATSASRRPCRRRVASSTPPTPRPSGRAAPA